MNIEQATKVLKRSFWFSLAIGTILDLAGGMILWAVDTFLVAAIVASWAWMVMVTAITSFLFFSDTALYEIDRVEQAARSQEQAASISAAIKKRDGEWSARVN